MPEMWNFTAADPYEAMQAGMAQARSNKLNDIKVAQELNAFKKTQTLNALMKSAIDPITGKIDANKLALGMVDAGFGEAVPGLQKEYAGLQEAQGKAAKERADASSAETKAMTDRWTQWRQLLPDDPIKASAWMRAVHQDNVIGPKLEQIGTVDDAIAKIPTDPKQYAKWREKMVFAADEEIKRNTMTATEAAAAATAAKNAESSAAQARASTARESRLAAEESSAGAGKPPKLKQGERWNAEKGIVEAVPGSELFVRQKRNHGTDFNTVRSTIAESTLGREKIDKLLDPKNKEEFGNLFGGYGAYATSRFPGKTSTLRTELNSLKSSLKAAGKKIISSSGGGAIGQITEREWPILESMIAELVPEMDEAGARQKMADIRNQLDKMEQMALDTYDETWGDSQFYSEAPRKEIEKARSKKPPAADEKPADAPVVVKSKADLDNLPSGALFIGPDGKIRRKP